MGRLNFRLLSLVRDSKDPALVMYVFENLGKGVPPESIYHLTFFEFQKQMQHALFGTRMRRANPSDPEYRLFVQRQLEQLAKEQTEKIEEMFRDLEKQDGLDAVKKL